MIDQRNLQEGPDLGQTTGETTVRFTRLGIAGRVVMGDRDGIGPGGDGGPEDLAGMGDAFIQTPTGNLPVIKQSVSGIE